jgi:hypothetical protein
MSKLEIEKQDEAWLAQLTLAERIVFFLDTARALVEDGDFCSAIVPAARAAGLLAEHREHAEESTHDADTDEVA